MELHPEVVKRLTEYGVGLRRVDDPLFEERRPARLGVYDVDDEELCHQPATAWCGVPGCHYQTSSLPEQTRHYESAHRYTCSQCRAVLPSPHLLHLHLQEEHDSFFAVCTLRKPSFSCYTEECNEKFWNAEDRFAHCVKVHKLPKDFRLDKSHKKSQKKNKQEQMEISEESGNPQPDVVAEGGIVSAPKHFSFGHTKTKCFRKGFNKFGSSEVKKDRHVDMDVIVNELKESLP